jgi:hypothetical protein
MTLKIRRTILNSLLVPAVAAVAAVSAVWIVWARNEYALELNGPLVTAQWWSSWRPSDGSDFLWALAGLSFMALIPLLSELILRRRFSRSPSPEMFFFRFFLLTLPFQVWRLALSPVVSAMLSFEIPITWGLTVARIAWFGRFLGIAALLNIGLYASDVPFRRSGTILGMGALAAMAVAVMLPLDSTQLLGNLLFRSGAETALALATVLLEVLAVLSLAGTAVTQRNSRYYLLASALLLVVVGSNFSFFLSKPLLAPGLVFILFGIMGFSREVRKIYQWL